MDFDRHDRRGFSLVELLVSMAVTSLVMGGVFSVMTSATRAQNSVRHVTNMNNNLRVAMDLLVRDMIQAGQGLPSGMVVSVPSGAGALPISIRTCRPSVPSRWGRGSGRPSTGRPPT